MPHRLPEAVKCPVCGSRPDIGVCDDWPKDSGPAPWYANCYSTQPIEHCVGGNGDNHRDAVDVWNRAVRNYRASGQPSS